jgi:hypothetical protein
MSAPIFDERPIAVIWDFDKTLIPGSMQWPLFEKFEVVEDDFWEEADHLGDFYSSQGLDLVSDDTLYLNHILSYVRAGKFQNLSNEMLRSLGGQLKFYPGAQAFLKNSKAMINDNPVYAEHKICLEHYVVSTGLRQMILGSRIAKLVDKVWACEFAEQAASPGYLKTGAPSSSNSGAIEEIVYTINNTTKTRAIFEINKGVNRDLSIDVNAAIDPADRRIPFENMIYIADGPSDVPVFSILNQHGGQTYAVYNPKSDKEFEQVFELNRQGRVNAFGPADYRSSHQSARWIELASKRVAESMVRARVEQRNVSLSTRIGTAPRHLKG